ncbi:HNH endonuclease [Chitinophaga pollutisoli]|uniref:HNH endonuclease n=1 Tax=Chitinophaga pollutisoli TaxID=3133966 RepID=A0ABZ2YQC9_9BACT
MTASLGACKGLLLIIQSDDMNIPDYNLLPISQKDFCCYCGKLIDIPKERTVEHLIPVSRGGNNHHYNKRTCCKKCNSLRGNHSLLVFIEILKTLYAVSMNPVEKYELEIMIMNAEYWQDYVNTAEDKLLRSKVNHK